MTTSVIDAMVSRKVFSRLYAIPSVFVSGLVDNSQLASICISPELNSSSDKRVRFQDLFLDTNDNQDNFFCIFCITLILDNRSRSRFFSQKSPWATCLIQKTRYKTAPRRRRRNRRRKNLRISELHRRQSDPARNTRSSK